MVCVCVCGGGGGGGWILAYVVKFCVSCLSILSITIFIPGLFGKSTKNQGYKPSSSAMCR